jgi:hypothetical protein
LQLHRTFLTGSMLNCTLLFGLGLEAALSTFRHVIGRYVVMYFLIQEATIFLFFLFTFNLFNDAVSSSNNTPYQLSIAVRLLFASDPLTVFEFPLEFNRLDRTSLGH